MASFIEPTDREIEAARLHGEEEAKTAVRAKTVRFVAKAAARDLELVRGGKVTMPVSQMEAFRRLPEEALAQLEVYPGGSTIASESMDLHFSVEALVFEFLMGPAWAQGLRRQAASRMGRTSSVAKTEAARANGAKGGRPRKAEKIDEGKNAPPKSGAKGDSAQLA